MSSGSVVSLSSFNILFFTQVLTVLTSTVKYNDYVTDKGKNISIPCDADGTIMWVKENFNNPTIIQTGKFLILTNVSESDRGIYVCFASVPTKTGNTEITVDEEKQSEDQSSKTIESNINTQAHQNNSYNNSILSSNSTIHTTTKTTATTATTTTTTPTSTTVTTTAKELTALTTSLPKTTRPVSSFADFFPPAALANSTIQQIEEEYEAYQKINLTVRTPPGPVTQLYFKASTILGFLIWRYNKTMSGGYPLRSFTAEFRNVSYSQTPYNSSMEHEWSRMDPINIAPNVRQMEVYRLEPNTTYEFRIWANNQLGSGAMVTTNVTTLPETKEEDLIRLIQPDLDNFDPRIWIVAVSIVLGTLVILAIGLCIVLSKECYQASHKGYEDGWDSIELLPNIILNPGFCESDGQDTPYTRTIIFGEDDDSDGYESESDHEPRMEKFKRKVSVFFTGPTIKRM